MTNPVIAVSDIVQAFDTEAIGSKVKPAANADFLRLVAEAARNFDWSSCEEPGQAFIPMPQVALELVSAGDGSTEGRTAKDYVVRDWRGQPQMFLRREFAAPATFCAVVLYTLEAYKADPEVTEERMEEFPVDTTHVVVAVLASGGPKPAVGYERFVKNLAGANNEYQNASADKLREMAKATDEYCSKWSVVAD